MDKQEHVFGEGDSMLVANYDEMLDNAIASCRETEEKLEHTQNILRETYTWLMKNPAKAHIYLYEELKKLGIEV